MARLRPSLLAVAVCGFAFAIAGSAEAAPRHHRSSDASSSVSYRHQDRYGHYSALVSDGSGTGFGFHRLPTGLRIAGAVGRQRQRDAVHSAIIDDAVASSNPYGLGIYGDSVYGYGARANYGVFSGADGYGSPYFAGFYGPGDGADLGPLGHAYAD